METIKHEAKPVHPLLSAGRASSSINVARTDWSVETLIYSFPGVFVSKLTDEGCVDEPKA